MTDKPDVEKWANAGVLFVCPVRAFQAALRAAAADGFRLVRVPDEMPARAMEPSFGAGHNACRDATLASAVEVGE